jgi:peptide/nickel transport system substrate-binding protein
MIRDSDSTRTRRIDRRTFLLGIGGGTVGLAGCGYDSPSGGEPTETENGEATPTDSGSDIQRGGKPILGMDTAPSDLNPLERADAYELEIIENIYGKGTIVHPETYEFEPWSFEDWTLEPDNIGTDEPTLTGQLRDDLTFSDGEPVTAEDVKFTIEYSKEQGVTGMVAASQFEAVEEITVDSADGQTVNYFFSRPDNGWFTNILGSIILPKHVWENVDNYAEYQPRNSEAGVVGVGPLVLADFDWENWFELEMRPPEKVPWPAAEYVDWIHEDAPFIEGLRVEIFGSETALEQAVLDGDVDVARGSFDVDRAADATQQDTLEVEESPNDGWHHHSFNVRRAPLDDPAFRQLLVLLNDKEWIVEDQFRGIGATKGSYATLPEYEEWRPPEPSEIDEYEGIPIPDLRFPGDRGSFQLSEDDIADVRQFLVDHSRAQHDYSFDEATTDASDAPDGQELYVDGEPLSDAHTDNDGNGGQGVLQMIHSPPDDSPKAVRLAERWMGVLKRVGVPIEPRVLGFDALTNEVLIKENFDIAEFGWTRTGPNNDHYRNRYGRWGADVESNQDTIMFNVMGYTGADDLIQEQSEMLDPEERKPVVKKVLARIYADAPADITHHEKVLQPVNAEYGGWVNTIGGVNNPNSWLNLRRRSD